MTNNQEQIFIGLDPGLEGALAGVNADGRLVELCDTPTMEVVIAGRPRRRYAVALMGRMMSEMVQRYRIAYVVLEDLNAFPPEKDGPMVDGKKPRFKIGASSALAMGKGVGLWLGLCGAFALRVKEEQASQWKRKMLPGAGGDKEAGRLKAIQLFPDRAQDFNLKKHHNRADAALMAEYARKYVVGAAQAAQTA